MSDTGERTGPVAPYHDEKEWLEVRRQGIGASEVAAILGVDGCPFDERDVYFNKVGGAEKEPTPYMERGRILEAPAANLYARETGRQLRRMPLVRHKELPILFADLDRQIFAGDDHPTAGLEIKVPAWHTYARVRKDGILPHWLIQAQVQKMVTGYPFIGFGILNADAWTMVTQDFHGIPDLEEKILEKVDKWWQDHIIAGTPPAPKIVEPLELPQVAVDTEIVKREDAEWLAGAAMLRESRAVLEEAQALDKWARDTLKDLMRDAGHRVVEGGGIRAYLQQNAGRVTFDKEGLKAVGPVSRNALLHTLQVQHHIPLSTAEKIADECQLDLSGFEKRGQGFESFRPYYLEATE